MNVTFNKVYHDNGSATKTYMVTYNLQGEEHILCVGMYEYQVDWLMRILELVDMDEFPELITNRS